nr:Elongation factor 1-alpha [Ipomoea batatas]
MSPRNRGSSDARRKDKKDKRRRRAKRIRQSGSVRKGGKQWRPARSNADCVVLIIDSTTGGLEAGAAAQFTRMDIPVTREHALLAFTLGVRLMNWLVSC